MHRRHCDIEGMRFANDAISEQKIVLQRKRKLIYVAAETHQLHCQLNLSRIQRFVLREGIDVKFRVRTFLKNR